MCELKHFTYLHEESKKNNGCAIKCEYKVIPISPENKNHKVYKLQINSKCISFLLTAKVILFNYENKAYSFRAFLEYGS